MVKLVKAFIRGFIGGPNFDNCVHHRLVLEDKLLIVDIPKSNVSAVSKPADVSFPYSSTSWFNQRRKIIYSMNMFICLQRTGCIFRQ